MNLRLEIREIIKSILNEGKNPFEVMDYYLKNEPALIKKLTTKDNALLKRLAYLDIEYNPEKLEVGKIFPWILNLWKKGDPVILNLISGTPDANLLNKFKSSQELFNKGSFKKSIGVTDIQKFKNVNDFIEKVSAAFIEPTELPAFANFNADEINKDIKEGIIARTNLSNDNFFIITPLKKKGACKYGNVHNKENQWCTSKVENNAFDSYKDGILYIFMDKKDNLKSKYQLFYKEGRFQFMDEFNRPFNYEGFFDENIDVFQKLFPSVVKNLENKEEGDPKLFSQIINYFPRYYKEIYFTNIEKFSKGLLADLIQINQGKINPEEFFSSEKVEEIAGFEYDDFTVYKDRIVFDCSLDSINDVLPNYFWAYKNGYQYYEFNSEEFDYMYNYIKEEDKPKWISVIKIFDKDFKDDEFNDDGTLYRSITDGVTEKYFAKLLYNFSGAYEEAVNNAQSTWIDGVMDKCPFGIRNDSITFEYKKVAEYCLQSSYLNPEKFFDIIERWMDKEGITDDNYYDYFNNQIDYSEAEKALSDGIDEIIENIKDDEELQGSLINKEKLDKFIKDLKFIKGYNEYYLDTEFARIKIKKIDLENDRIFIQYFELKNDKKHEGWIGIDDLPRYSTTPMLFEIKKIREIIRELLNK